jgi:xanthine dehydrogenase YagS FAD-binding subunit
MNPFSYIRPANADAALRAAQEPGAKFLGGGTNLLDLAKAGVEQPTRMIDITRLPYAEIAALPDGGVRIGALARNSDAANHELIRLRYPLLAQALLAGASPQLRNMATVGGNLMQRTRCYYFADTSFGMCNKRNPGSGCAAREGYNRIHAILGTSEQCIATHPSDMCVALLVLDAIVRVRGRNGERAIPIGEFHRLPGSTPQIETALAAGELIVAVDLPPSAYAGHSHYLKLRDRASYAFALVSVAAALDTDTRGGVVRSARIGLGGVAPKPWRATNAERVLAGRTLDASTLAAAAEAAVSGAQPYRDNRFKVELARAAVVRALEIAGGIA